MASCLLGPLCGIPIAKSYPSRSIAPAIIGLALSAVLTHSVIGEMLLGTPTALYIVYAVIMGVLVFVYSQVEPFLLFTLRRRMHDDDAPQAKKPEIQPDPLDVLSTKEREVAELIRLGHTNGDIAKMLFISEHTVKDHTKKYTPSWGYTAAWSLQPW